MLSKIYIRADASAAIGMGHIIRCLALAAMLKQHFSLIFVCIEIPEESKRTIHDSGFGLIMISNENDFFNFLSKADIAVVDSYGYTSSDHQKLRFRVGKLVCIDDLHDKKFHADLVINHAPNISKGDYISEPYTQFALGLNYALLRPAFLKAARESLGDDKELGSLLICFGGADSRNLTSKTLDIALELDLFKKIVIVMGPSYKFAEELKRRIASSNNVELYQSIDEELMLSLMKKAELVIIPSSGILLEAVSLRCKIISGMYVENQKFFFENYLKLGAFTSANDFSTESLRSAMIMSVGIKNSPTLVDGESGNRILKLFLSLLNENNINLRVAEKRDEYLTYRWASDKIIRAYSFNQNDISPEDHSAWYQAKILDSSCYYYIAELNGQVVGSIRFDIVDKDATISYLIDSEFHNKGLGITILKAGLSKFLQEANMNLNNIIGWVMCENIPSNKTFEKLPFIRSKENEKYKYTYSI